MRKFGLIGYPLSHSFSKKFFNQKFQAEGIEDCEYDLYPIKTIDLLGELLMDNPDLEGLNVTIPYKLEVLPFLNEIDEAARAIGAVNCIRITGKQKFATLKGFNTDAYGFEESLKPLLEPWHNKAIVLGDGGAAKAIKYVLNKLGMPFIIVTRSPTDSSILYDEIDEELLSEYTVVINTTPLGMSPNVVSSPDLPYQYLTANHLAYDLVYNPEETTFLNKAKVQDAKIKNGLEMLYLQAERSWYLWNR
ncbi:shikimate dehydrogenase family protein [Pedobacter sp. JCM 36344]|uniref:shikimate dehydrogenase family protein n=1 Tax=Pedobacter sp. JCM 36344 TaxID=3374280 RepID=UPI00397C6098